MKPRTLGVLGGRDLPPELLRIWALSADRILAADSGADQVLAVGLKPHAVIGDMDSVSAHGLQHASEVLIQTDQDFTDCDKLLQYADDEKVGELTLSGVEGDRLDHVMSSLYSCVRSQITIRLALRRGIGYILKPGQHEIEAPRGRRLSLLPIGTVGQATLRGVRWELSNVELAPGGRVSVSNFSTESLINVSFESGAALLVVEYSAVEMPIW